MNDPSRADTGTPSPDTTNTSTTDAFPTDAETETIRRAIRALGQRPTITEAIAANVARINELLRPFHALARDADGGDPAVALKNGWVLNTAKGLRKPNTHNAGRDIDLGTCAFPAAVLREVLTELSERALRLAASEEARLRTLAAAVNALAGQPIDVPRVVEHGEVSAVPQGAVLPEVVVGSWWLCAQAIPGIADAGDTVQVARADDATVVWQFSPVVGAVCSTPVSDFVVCFQPIKSRRPAT